MPYIQPTIVKETVIQLAIENPKMKQREIADYVNSLNIPGSKPISQGTIAKWLLNSGVEFKGGRGTALENQELNDALIEIVRETQPTTCRAVFYQAVVRGLIEKSESAVQKISKHLISLRDQSDENGDPDPAFPIDWIVDGVRRVRRPYTVLSAQEALRDTADQYRRHIWQTQDVMPFIVIEKMALVGVVEDICNEWDVPLVPLQGFASISLAYSVARLINNAHEDGKTIQVFHFGDYDPSGVLIDPAFERRLRRYAPDAEIEFERVAILPRHIEVYNLPTRPTKTAKNNHAKSWDGGESVELDALPTPRLRQMVTDSILSCIDDHELDIMRAAEESERELFERMANRDFAGMVNLMEAADEPNWLERWNEHEEAS